MSALKLTTFGGMQPRKDIADLPNNYAEKSVGVNYYSGDLVPFKSFESERQVPDYAKTIFPFTKEDGTFDWFVSDRYLKIIKHHGTAYNQRIIASNTQYPLTTDFDKFPRMTYLGVPKPAETPIAILGGGGVGTPLSTVYVYTFVNDYGEESEPSEPAHAILRKEGQLVLVKIGEEPIINGVDIEKKRIYRSVATGTTSDYFFLAEVPAQQTSYVDTKLNENLGEVLPTTDWNAPVEGLRGIIQLSNGIYVGHTDREIFFSEPYIAYAFPRKYSISINVDIVSIEKTGKNSIIVGTVEKPVFIYGDRPGMMTVTEGKANYPTIPNSMVDIGQGVMYATSQGLVFAQSSSKVALITKSSLTKEVFESVLIEGVHAFYDSNKYNLVCKYGTLIANINYPDFISYVEDKPDCAYFEESTEDLYTSTNGHLIKNNSDDELSIPYTWKSKNIRNEQFINMSAYRVLADYEDNMTTKDSIEGIHSVAIGEDVGVGLFSLTQIDKKRDYKEPFILIKFTRGKKYIFKRYIQTNETYRLPKNYKDDKISFEIKSNIRIREIHIGTTPFSLKKT